MALLLLSGGDTFLCLAVEWWHFSLLCCRVVTLFSTFCRVVALFSALLSSGGTFLCLIVEWWHFLCLAVGVVTLFSALLSSETKIGGFGVLSL